MTNKTLEDVLNESLYLGNTKAFEELEESLKCGGLLAFVGAGASSPIFPTWYSVLNQLNNLAKTQGHINEGDHLEIAAQLDRDPLEVASTLENIFTKEVFRAKLANLYRVKNDLYTACHVSIVKLKIKGIITLNFDECLEHAYVHIHNKKADAFRAHDRSETVRWLQGGMFTEGGLPILHLHGTISDPTKMVFTSDDYNAFYRDEHHLRLVKDLWTSEQMLAIGFGFTDPFLTRVAEQTLRDIPSEARHYAFVGKHGAEAISPIKRKTFIKKYRLIPIFYQIRQAIDRLDEDHSDLQVLLDALVVRARGSEECLSQPARSVQPPIVDRSSASALLQAAERDFESQLFVAPTSGKVLYVEPKLVLPQEAGIFVDGALYAPALTDVVYLVESTDSYLISALPEHGLTLLCKRLVKEFRGKGVTAFFYDSENLPNYKKKLLIEFPQAAAGVTADTVLILDNFDIERHERLLNELIGLGYFSRFVICCQAKRGLETQGVDVDAFPIKLKLLTLSNLDRSDIRSLSSTLFDTSDADWVSGIVERVYEDLLELCIPLTPSNVVMYLTILYNEGDFRPLNRIQIVERYIYQLLRSAGELYRDTFGMKNKMDVISAFAFDMYKANKTSCKEAEWYEFCRRYMDSTLFEFDDRHLLESLISARIFFRYGHELYFKYKLFYSFFLGKYVANRQVVLSEFMRTDAYLATVDLVEVISASSVDNTQLIADLTDKLGESVREFGTQYGFDETDPFVDFPWTVDEQEEEKIWEPLAKNLTAGPASPSELDRLKRSLLAEKRTQDQNVVLRRFDIAERKCFSYLYALVAALRNSDSIEGSLKKRAVEEIFAGFSCLYHVGLIYAPLIARHRAFVWNGVAFINAIEHDDDVRADEHKRTFLVMLDMANAVVKAASSAIGTRKLGEVFKALVLGNAPCDLRWYLNYTCIIRSKPRLWNEVAERMVDNTDRRSFYLRNMLYETYRQFSEEVSTVKEREGLKRIIARVKTKRALKKKNPSLKAVNRVLGRLERAEFFEKKADEN